MTTKGGSGISEAPPPLLVEPPTHPSRDPSFPRTGATFTSLFTTIVTFLAVEFAIKGLTAVAMANVSRKPAVDLDQLSLCDNINIERRRQCMLTGGREMKPRYLGTIKAFLKLRK